MPHTAYVAQRGRPPQRGHSLSHLAVDLRALGEPEGARKLDEQALAMWQRLAQS
jgi:hypothetical protein